MTDPTPDTRQHASPFYTRVFAIATVLVLGTLLYRLLEPFYSAVTWALFIAFLLHPLHSRLTRRFGNRRPLSAFVLTLATFVVLVGPLTALTAAIASQAGDLLQPIEAGAWQADRIQGDLHELETGAKPGRLGAEEITLFKSVGAAIEDLTAANLLVGG